MRVDVSHRNETDLVPASVTLQRRISHKEHCLSADWFSQAIPAYPVVDACDDICRQRENPRGVTPATEPLSPRNRGRVPESSPTCGATVSNSTGTAPAVGRRAFQTRPEPIGHQTETPDINDEEDADIASRAIHDVLESVRTTTPLVNL